MAPSMRKVIWYALPINYTMLKLTRLSSSFYSSASDILKFAAEYEILPIF